jgi:hypothetical protein
MRNLRCALVVLLAFAVIGAGCYESLTSVVTRDKLVFYDGLAGEYRLADPGSGSVRITAGGEKSYKFEQFDDAGKPTNRGTLHVIKLGEEHFYEITVSDFRTVDDKPVYAIGRLVIQRDADDVPAKSLTGFAFQSKDKFFDDPEVTTSEFTYDERGERKTTRALSMPAERLQACLAANAEKMTKQELRLERTAATKAQ